METRVKLLYLDDEENNLISFKALFRRDYDVFTTSSAQEAVQYLNENEVPVILSDQKMPDISGVEFFELTIPDFPNAVRVLVTGYADMEAVIDAINKGQVYRYVTKPWDENELKMTIDNAIDKYYRDKDLVARTKELERANAELEKFVYSASHDLRAPVVSMQGVLKVVKAEGVEGPSSEYFEMMERSVNKLSDIVDNIIHYYQNMRSDEILQDVEFDSFIDQVLGTSKGYDPNGRLKIVKDITQSSAFKCDTHRLQVVVANLISNAIKFQDPQKQEPILEVQIVQNAEKAVIRVTDNGLGIAPDLLPSVFDMFYKSDEKNVGSGIGLYIAKEATEKMGGKISVTSDPLIQTRFTLEIPNRS